MVDRRSAVLVVDDDRTSRLMLNYRLELSGLETAMCENGLQALELMRQKTFDLVLLDILMPDLDGYSTLEIIKKDPQLRDIPIVMISALGEMDSVIRCLEMGADDYMPKPLDALLLSTRVNALLVKAQLREQKKEFRRLAERLTSAAVEVTGGGFNVENIADLFDHEDVGSLARQIAYLATEYGNKTP